MTTTSHDEALAEAKRSLARPLSADESIEFARGAIEILEDPDHVRQFEQDIEEVSVAAIEIDNSFDRVGRSFQDMVNKHGHDFPELAGFKREWDGYKDVNEPFLNSGSEFFNHFISNSAGSRTSGAPEM